MLLAAVLFLISAVAAGLVDTLGLPIVFRVIGGIGVGIASVIAAAYIAEIAPAAFVGDWDRCSS
jgi:MFS transporter, SP family, sugar:H+ symporter